MTRKLHKLSALMLVMILSVGFCTVAAAAHNTADFSDVPGTHWAYGYIMEMADIGIIKGVSNGKFALGESLKLNEFLRLSVEPCIPTTVQKWERGGRLTMMLP